MFPFPLYAPIEEAAVIPAVSSWTFVGSTTSTTGSISVHGSAQAGDLAILYDRAINSSGSAPSLVLPPDFSPISGGFSDGIVRCRMSVSAKILTAGGGSLTGMDGTQEDDKMLVILRANAPLTSFTVNDLEEYYGSGDPPTKTINASGVTEALVVLCSNMTRSGNPSYSTINSNPDFDADLLIASAMQVSYKIYNSSPVNHTYDVNDNSSFDGVQAFFVTGTV